MPDPLDLDELERLHKAATPEPWKPNEWSGEDGGWVAVGPHHEPSDIPMEDWGDNDDEPGERLHKLAKADSALLVALRAAFPELLARARRLEAAERVVEAARDWRALASVNPGLREQAERARVMLFDALARLDAVDQGQRHG